MRIDFHLTDEVPIAKFSLPVFFRAARFINVNFHQIPARRQYLLGEQFLHSVGIARRDQAEGVLPQPPFAEDLSVRRGPAIF